MQIITFIDNLIKNLWKKGAFHIFVGSILTKFVAFFGSIFLVRVLSKTLYGILGYIENIYGYVYILAGMGLGNAILRYVILGKTTEEKHWYYKYVLNKGSLFNIILVLISIFVVYFYPHPEKFISAQWLAIIMIMTLPFQYITDCNIFTYRAMFANKRYAINAFFISTALIFIKLISAVMWDLKGVIIAYVVAYFLISIILTFETHKEYFKESINTVFLECEKKKIDCYAVQYMITNGIWAIFMLNDIFLLGRLCGDASIIADYKVAYVLPGNLAIISSAIGIFISPYFVRHETEDEWVWKNYKRVIGLTVGLIGITAIILSIFSKPIIVFLYGSQYENVVVIMRLLLVASFINSGIRFTTANLLAAMGQIKYNMIVSFTGVILQVLLNLYLIPRYGSMGVAITSITVYSLMAIILCTVFVKKYRNSHN